MTAIHNCVIHPLLFLSRYLEHKGHEKTSYLIDLLHDATKPEDDPWDKD